MILPALRHLDAAPVEDDGRTFICVSDPEGIVEEQYALSGAAFFIAACLDGTTSVEDVQQAFKQQFGAAVSLEDVQKVVDFLDRSGLLFSEAFFAMKAEACRRFAALETRSAWLAGKSYPEEPSELRAYLSQMLAGNPAECSVDGDAQPPQRLRCLIAPHIDFERGAQAYAAAYAAARGARKPRLIFVFGVAHAGADAPFILTRKAFDTPLGTLKTDLEVVERLAGACRWDPFAAEIAHRTEHSIEFQAVMLAHVFGPDLEGIRIVPILCGPFGDDLEATAEFLAACRNEAPGSDVLVVAGADLAHVGRRFGDDFDVDETVLRGVERRDHEDLTLALNGDAAGFHASVMRDGNARKVCGLGCIYAALSVVDGCAGNGQLLHYGFAEDPAGGIVSFAGAAFWGKAGASRE